MLKVTTCTGHCFMKQQEANKRKGCVEVHLLILYRLLDNPNGS